MMNRLSLAAAVAASLLGACTTNPDGTRSTGAPGSPMWMVSASAETKMAYFRAQCEGYGYTAGTPDFARCTQYEAHAASARAERALDDLAEHSQRQAEANAAAVSFPRQTINCVSYGNRTTCN